MGNVLEAPNTDKDGEHRILESVNLRIGASGMQGWRVEMEDAHIISPMPSRKDHIFVAIFDGHGGSGSAHFAEKNLITVIEETANWRKYCENKAEDINLLGQALIDAFLEIDKCLRLHQSSGDTHDSSGCTAVTCMITPKYFICANAGDSRCVLGTNGNTVPLSEDHKPTDTLESRRIIAAGGKVLWKRVDGDLAVSRALGDFSFKSEELDPVDTKVTCYPDITIQERSDKDEMLILACDGLWDVMSSSDATELIREIYAHGEHNMELVCEEMLDLALHKGSQDNISAVIVKLAGGVIGPGEGGVIARRAKREQLQDERMKKGDRN